MGLFRYISSRVGSYLVVLFIGLTITFFLPRLMPGDPIEQYIFELQSTAGQSLSPEEMAYLRETLSQIYGLEGSLLSQYLGYLERVIFHFDFGPSFSGFPTPVLVFIMRALPWTLGLLVMTTLISWTLGNLIGLIAGYFHDSRAANALEVFGILLYPIPYYIVALVLIMSIWLHMANLSTNHDHSSGAVNVRKGTSHSLQFIPARADPYPGQSWLVHPQYEGTFLC